MYSKPFLHIARRQHHCCKKGPSHAFKAALAPLSESLELNKRTSHTKLTATIGPASEQLPVLTKVGKAGLDLMRINFSHATYEEADLRVKNLNLTEALVPMGPDTLGVTTNMRSIVLDTQGPEIRTGSFADVKELELTAGDEILLTNDDSWRTRQTKDKLWISYKRLAEGSKPGAIILVDDGSVLLEVQEIVGKELRCKILNTGVLGNKKGVNMPGLIVDLPAISDKDRQDLRWGIKNSIDYIAASFVRKPRDVHEIRDYCRQVIAELYPNPEDAKKIPLPKIISKIESTEGMENFEEILQVTDGVMVARGDLAVEIPLETLAGVQKEIVQRCNKAGKPVIVATQMLETMTKNPRPTRAEITDVSNAVIDGADCVMLSGESAKGKYPSETIYTMKKIVNATELNQIALNSTGKTNGLCSKVGPEEALAYSAVQLSNVLYNGESGKHALVLSTPYADGDLELKSTLPALLSKFRPQVPIYVLVPTYKAGRMIQLHRNIQPILCPANKANSTQEISALLKNYNLLTSNDRFVYVSTTGLNIVSVV